MLLNNFRHPCLNENVHSHSTRLRNYPHIQAINTHIMSTNFLCKGPEIWCGFHNDIEQCKTRYSSIITLRIISSHQIEWDIDYLEKGLKMLCVIVHIRMCSVQFVGFCLGVFQMHIINQLKVHITS